MVKSETHRDAEILVRNPSPRLFGKKFRYSKKVKTNHAKTRLRDLSKTLPRFRDPAKIFRDPLFSWYHFATPISVTERSCAAPISQLESHIQLFRERLSEKVLATIPKGDMGYDQYTVPDTVAVEPTFVAFL